MVLDVGAGRGLRLVGAAKRLTTGKAIGIDIWRAVDLSGNTRENALANIKREGVSNDRVEVRTGDIRKTDFADRNFDVVLSLLCRHNIEDDAGRENACREIARVLKPGGTAIIGDYIPTTGYAKLLANSGMRIESSRPYFRDALSLCGSSLRENPRLFNAWRDWR